MTKTAILLINLGTPDAPTKPALKRYLKEFLSDPRVIDLPRWQWLPILHGIILNTRPAKSAHAYQQVWTEKGSPLLLITEEQTTKIREKLPADLIVDYAMRYGNPSVESKCQALAKAGVERLLFIPMYPQYADATTASVFDAVALAMTKQRGIPELRFVRSWQTHPQYIAALVESIRQHFQQYGQPEKLLFSYHGVPARYATEGDPYPKHCEETTAAVVQALGLQEDQYLQVYQSRFGREVWLQPYADETIRDLAQKGCESISVICPGFSVDCLETLEEMAEENKAIFLENGGKRYDYIPALNAEPAHIDLLLDLVKEHTQGWGIFLKEKEENK